MNTLQYAVISFSVSLILLCLGGGRVVLILLTYILVVFLLRAKVIGLLMGLLGAISVWYMFLFQQQQPLYSHGSIQTLSGLVVTTSKRNAFVLQDEAGHQRYVTHKAKISLGDRVVVKGYVTHTKFFSANILDTSYFIPYLSMSIFMGSFDYPAWLAMKGYRGGIMGFDVHKQGTCIQCLAWWHRVAYRLIQEVERWRGDTEQAGLLLGLLIGHRGMLSEQTNDQFAESGLIHIIAVSGGNLAIIASLFGLILFRLPVYVRFFVVCIILCLYSLLCGLDSSVVRALIMAILSLIAIFLGRPTLSLRILAIAYLLMLIRNPLYLLYDLGFQLSYIAVLGIILFQQSFVTTFDDMIQNYQKIFKYCVRAIWSHVLVSCGAFLFTLPILILAMGKVNVTGFLSNIFLVPFIPLLQIGGLISTWTNQWLESQQLILWILDMVIAVAHRTQVYGIQIIIEQIWVRWVLFMMWGGVVFMLVMRFNRMQHTDQGVSVSR